MTNPTPTPAEIAEIVAEARRQIEARSYIRCLCSGEPHQSINGCQSVAALLSAASRGIAPPSEEVNAYIAALAVRDPDTDWDGWMQDHREGLRELLLRLYAPPVAAPSGEAAPREAVEIVKEVNEIMTPCSSHAPVPAASCRGCLWKTIGRLSNSLRTLSQGKAAAEARAVAEDAELKVGEHAERYQAMLAALTALGCKLGPEGWIHFMCDENCMNTGAHKDDDGQEVCNGCGGTGKWLPIPGAGARGETK